MARVRLVSQYNKLFFRFHNFVCKSSIYGTGIPILKFHILSPNLKMDYSNKKSESSPRMTRKAMALKEKDKYLNMNLEDKRKVYKCRDRYQRLEDVPSWPEYFHKEKLEEKRKPKQKYDVVYEPNIEVNKKVSIWKGDITCLEIDGIVNAANNSLLGGGGVDGAIHAASGSMLKAECATLSGCETGDAKITGGYKLPARYIIHTVGPIGEKKPKLLSAYKSCLEQTKLNGLKSVAFPCISTGIYGYPNGAAAHVAMDCVRMFLENEETGKNIERIIFCLFMREDVKLYEELMQIYFPITTASIHSDNTDTEITADEKAPSESTEVVADQKAPSHSTKVTADEKATSESTEVTTDEKAPSKSTDVNKSDKQKAEDTNLTESIAEGAKKKDKRPKLSDDDHDLKKSTANDVKEEITSAVETDNTATTENKMADGIDKHTVQSMSIDSDAVSKNDKEYGSKKEDKMDTDESRKCDIPEVHNPIKSDNSTTDYVANNVQKTKL